MVSIQEPYYSGVATQSKDYVGFWVTLGSLLELVQRSKEGLVGFV